MQNTYWIGIILGCWALAQAICNVPRRTVDLTVPKLLAQSEHSVEDGLVRLEKGR